MQSTMQQLYRTGKRIIRDLACRHFHLHAEPLILDLSELSSPLPLIRNLGLHCRGLIHVGANTGQEFYEYKAAGLEQVVYIEPLPSAFKELERRIFGEVHHHAIRALCADQDGVNVTLHVASNHGMSSSILEFGFHAIEHPDVTYTSNISMPMTTLDKVIFENPLLRPEALDCLVIDVQGAELQVIKGAHRVLENCRFVFLEVNDGGLYAGDCSVQDIIKALSPYRLKLRQLGINRHKWGNAFFVRA
jgi:FkbM family methyltransferase